MFIGHFALALGAKKLAPKVSLGVLFLACQLADMLWPNMVLLGLEQVAIVPGITALTPLDFLHYPYSHSLVALIFWAVLLAGVYTLLQRAGLKAAMVIAGLVLSHWTLDVLTHRADMPIGLNDSTLIGLGLWNHPLLAVASEASLFAAGLWLYVRETKPLDRQGSLGLWALVVFLSAIYVASIFGPPPPSVEAIVWAGQSLWILVAWGFWVDRHRISVSAQQREE